MERESIELQPIRVGHMWEAPSRKALRFLRFPPSYLEGFPSAEGYYQDFGSS